ncbi:MAG TPA: hypothetical protein VGH19_15050 [Verrucomicrobiae bacterium]
MKKEPKKNAELQLLNLLKQILPKATDDAKLASKIYSAIESELKSKARVKAFDTFCEKVALPDLEAQSIAEVKEQLAASFGDGDVTIKPNKKEQTLTVEVAMPDGTQFTSEIKVNPDAKNESDEQEVKLKFIPFPVSLPGDKELVWIMAKRESMSNDEAAIALTKLEEDFWATKAGQKLQKDRVEKCFPEFIARVPGGMLTEVGLKRHYKTPEVLKVLRSGGQTK